MEAGHANRDQGLQMRRPSRARRQRGRRKSTSAVLGLLHGQLYAPGKRKLSRHAPRLPIMCVSHDSLYVGGSFTAPAKQPPFPRLFEQFVVSGKHLYMHVFLSGRWNRIRQQQQQQQQSRKYALLYTCFHYRLCTFVIQCRPTLPPQFN